MVSPAVQQPPPGAPGTTVERCDIPPPRARCVLPAASEAARAGPRRWDRRDRRRRRAGRARSPGHARRAGGRSWAAGCARGRSTTCDGDATPVTMSRGFHAFFRQYYNLRALLRRVDPALESLTAVPDYPLVARRRAPGLVRQGARGRRRSTWPPSWPRARASAPPTSPRSTRVGRGNCSTWTSRRRSPHHDGESASAFLDRLRFPDGARHLALEVFARSFFARPGRLLRRGAGRHVPQLLPRVVGGLAVRRPGRRLRHRVLGAARRLPASGSGSRYGPQKRLERWIWTTTRVSVQTGTGDG